MRPLFRVSTDSLGIVKKVEFMYKDGLVEDITENVFHKGFSVEGGNQIVLSISALAVTGETIKEEK